MQFLIDKIWYRSALLNDVSETIFSRSKIIVKNVPNSVRLRLTYCCVHRVFCDRIRGMSYMPTPCWHRAESPWFSLTFWALNVNTRAVYLSYNFAYIHCVVFQNSSHSISVGCFSVRNSFRTPRTALRSPRVIPQRDFCQAEAPRGENNCSKCCADLWAVRTHRPSEHNYYLRNYNTLFVWACEPFLPDYNLTSP